MLFVNILLCTTIVIALILSLLILVSNPRKRVNQSLFGFVMAIFLWLLTNLLTNLSPNPSLALFFGRSTLVTGALIPYAMLIFSFYYVNAKVTLKRALKWSILPIILIIFSPTPLNIASIDAYGLNAQTGVIYYLLVVELLVYVGYVLRLLYKEYKKPQTSPLQRVQLRYIFAGFIGATVPIFILNVIVPLVTPKNSDTAILFGPNAIIFLALFTTIAIVRHRLLDIRLIVARTLAYVMLLGSLIATYAVLVLVVSQHLAVGSQANLIRNIIPFFGAIFLALAYGPLKRFFDRTTNKYFYQDAYEPQTFLDELNGVLVSSLDLRELLNNATEVITKNLRASFVLFGIYDGDDRHEALFGPKEQALQKGEMEKILSSSLFRSKKHLLTDDLEEQNIHYKTQLSEQNIALVILLRNDASLHHTPLGYMTLGVKKSGSIYSEKDVQLIEIIANEMVIAIQNALRFEEIQNFAVTLQEKVNDATHKLRRTNEKLKALDETKDDFISMASHQLRTPLTSVKGYVSMVLEGDAGKITKQQHQLLDQAFVSSQRMVFLIADLLNVSRLKTGKFVIDAKSTNLADVVESEMDQLKATAKSRGLKLEYERPKQFPMLNLDETKIRQVVMNFSDNAIYYTPTGGVIKVVLVDKPDSIELTVNDNGIGVPKAEQHHLFGKFYRAGNAKKARPDGTGLGLFMAQKVIVAQGGAVIFHSEEGKGSTFGFSFPKSKLRAN